MFLIVLFIKKSPTLQWYRCVQTNAVNSNINNIAATGVTILSSIEGCKKLCHNSTFQYMMEPYIVV